MRIKFSMEGEGEEEDFDCDSSVVEVDATKDGSDGEAADSSDSQTTLILNPVPRKKPKLWLLQKGQ